MGNRVRIDGDDGTVRAVRSVRRSGGSMVVSIPRQLLEAAGFEEGDDVELVAKMRGDEICFHLDESDEE